MTQIRRWLWISKYYSSGHDKKQSTTTGCSIFFILLFFISKQDSLGIQIVGEKKFGDSIIQNIKFCWNHSLAEHVNAKEQKQKKKKQAVPWVDPAHQHIQHFEKFSRCISAGLRDELGIFWTNSELILPSV